VHIVHLGDAPVVLTVDAEFDSALRSDGRLALVYRSDPDQARLAVAHGAHLAKMVRADEALLVRVQGGTAELVRVSATKPRVLGRAHLDWLRVHTATDDALVGALDVLFQGRIETQSLGQAQAQGAEGPTADKHSPTNGGMASHAAHAPASLRVSGASGFEPRFSTRRRRLRSAGLSLVGLGSTALATGMFFEIKRARAHERIAMLERAEVPDARALANARDESHRSRGLRWIGVGGGALLTASVPMFRIDVADGVPWWSYFVGGAGLALVAWGSIELARDRRCDLKLRGGGCATDLDRTGRTALLWSTASPLLALQ
jgi:hypothetical protein